jgi:hypothetical protein
MIQAWQKKFHEILTFFMTKCSQMEHISPKFHIKWTKLSGDVFHLLTLWYNKWQNFVTLLCQPYIMILWNYAKFRNFWTTFSYSYLFLKRLANTSSKKLPKILYFWKNIMDKMFNYFSVADSSLNLQPCLPWVEAWVQFPTATSGHHFCHFST